MIVSALTNVFTSGHNMPLKLDIAMSDGEPASLQPVVRALSRLSGLRSPRNISKPQLSDGLPKTIYFPYSRHSSYPELCQLVAQFRPKDVWPCTVDRKQWMADGMLTSILRMQPHRH